MTFLQEQFSVLSATVCQPSHILPSEKTSSSAMEADGRLHGSPSCSSSVGHCRLLLIQARRLTVEDGLSMCLSSQTAGVHDGVKAIKNKVRDSEVHLQLDFFFLFLYPSLNFSVFINGMFPHSKKKSHSFSS